MKDGRDWVNISEFISSYIQKTEKVFEDIKLNKKTIYLNENKVNEAIDEAKRYFEDAKYYLSRKKFKTSLTSIAYCEGILDALRILNFVEFSW